MDAAFYNRTIGARPVVTLCDSEGFFDGLQILGNFMPTEVVKRHKQMMPFAFDVFAFLITASGPAPAIHRFYRHPAHVFGAGQVGKQMAVFPAFAS